MARSEVARSEGGGSEGGGSDVDAFIDTVAPAKRQRDARTVLAMLRRITGDDGELQRSAVGFGQYHYKYASGREGDAPAAGFAPRKAAMSIYLMDGVGAHEDDLAKLGPHTHGAGCLYLKDLETVDLEALERILRTSWETLDGKTYTQRAKDGGKS